MQNVSRRDIFLKYIPGAFALGALSWVGKKYLLPRSVADVYIELLGRDTMLPLLAQQPYGRNEHTRVLQQRLAAAISKPHEPVLKTKEDALAALQRMIQFDYAYGLILNVDGWILPESLLLTNVYYYRYIR